VELPQLFLPNCGVKILLVEDDSSLTESILAYLKQDGYICEHANNFLSAVDKVMLHTYDLAILDITIPGGNGLDIIHELKKKRAATGIIILSAKNSLDDKITGLDLGADDYLTKPFQLSELNARIKAVIRRRNFEGKKEIQFNEISIVPDSATALVKGLDVELTRKEFQLLLYFISNKNRVLTKEAIVSHLWGDNAEDATSFDYIYTHIKNLRKKLIEKGSADYVQSIYGLGYKFSEK